MDLEKLCFQVQDIAREVGAFIYAERQKFSAQDIIAKGKSDFVTYVDRTSEQKIVEGLKAVLPGSGFITEEGTAHESGEQYRWIIDPLDGTTNYIHHLSPFAVSIALLDGAELVLGVVFEISLNEMFYAWKGGKAWCNGKEIRVSEAATTRDALIATGFPYYDFSFLDAYMKAMDFFMRNSHGLRRLGSAATDIAYVASGRFEAFYEHALHAWDVAAGIVILREAGGKVCDFNGGDNYLFGGEIIMANSNYFDEFYGVVNSYLGSGK